MKKIRGLKAVIVVLVLAVLVGGYYYYLSHRTVDDTEDVTEITKVQETLQRNLTTDYPQTPKEVVKYFSEITQCFVNEDYTDEELKALDDKMLGLFDEELKSYKTEADYYLDLQTFTNSFKENGYKVSSYSPSASTDVEYFTQDDHECARLWCVYTLKAGKYYEKQQYVFILRKDEDSHWKIFGWELAEDD